MVQQQGEGGRKRKPLMIDSRLADAIKEIAARHGMTISAYMRALLTGAIEAENSNLFAPIILRRALISSKLRRAGVALIPLSLLDSCSCASLAEQARHEGRKLGTLLRSIGVELEEALDIILGELKIALREHDRIVLLPPSQPSEEAVKTLAEGIAESYGARIAREKAGITIIWLKQ